MNAGDKSSGAKPHTTTSYSEAKAQEQGLNATRGGVTPEISFAPLTRWQRFCWWLAAALAPKDGSRYGPAIFGRSVKHDA